MIDLLDLQKQLIRAHLHEGERACDFTMGNGHDTAFLSKTVGENGCVTAFDIQPAALCSTAETLRREGCPENWRLICDSHHNAAKYLDAKINAGMFNLGYMPGGDHSKTTLRETTLPAVEAALEMLAPGGILIVAVYPGHKEGALEGEMLKDYFSGVSRYKYSIGKFRFVNSPDSPYFFVATASNKL